MNDMSYNKIYAQSDEAIVMQLCGFLKKTRIEQKLSQQQLATNAGISRSTLSLIERGTAPSMDTLIKLLRALGRLDLFNEFKYIPKKSPLEAAEQDLNERQRIRPKKESDNDPKSDW